MELVPALFPITRLRDTSMLFINFPFFNLSSRVSGSSTGRGNGHSTNIRRHLTYGPPGTRIYNAHSIRPVISPPFRPVQEHLGKSLLVSSSYRISDKDFHALVSRRRRRRYDPHWTVHNNIPRMYNIIMQTCVLLVRYDLVISIRTVIICQIYTHTHIII